MTLRSRRLGGRAAAAGLALRHGRGNTTARSRRLRRAPRVLDRPHRTTPQRSLQTSVLRDYVPPGSTPSPATGRHKLGVLAPFFAVPAAPRPTAGYARCPKAAAAPTSQPIRTGTEINPAHPRRAACFGREGDLLGAADHALEAGQPAKRVTCSPPPGPSLVPRPTRTCEAARRPTGRPRRKLAAPQPRWPRAMPSGRCNY